MWMVLEGGDGGIVMRGDGDGGNGGRGGSR